MFYTCIVFGSVTRLCCRCKITTSLNLGFFLYNIGLVLPCCPEQRSNERMRPQEFTQRSAQSRGSQFCFLSLSLGRWLPLLQSHFFTPSSFCKSLFIQQSACPSSSAFCSSAFFFTFFFHSQLHCLCPIYITRSLSYFSTL